MFEKLAKNCGLATHRTDIAQGSNETVGSCKQAIQINESPNLKREIEHLSSDDNIGGTYRHRYG